MTLPGVLMCLTCPVQDNPKQRAAAQQINGWSDNPENVDISAVSVLDDDGASGVGAAAAAAVSVALARSWASAASQKQVSLHKKDNCQCQGAGPRFLLPGLPWCHLGMQNCQWEATGSCASKRQLC